MSDLVGNPADRFSHDVAQFQTYQLSRLCLHNKRRSNYREKHNCSSRYIMLGVDDMAVQTLMETESDNDGFQNDCLKYVEKDDS